MPIYEYLCPECQKEVAVSKPMAKSSSVEVCQKCGTAMDKQITMPAIHGTRDGFGINKAFVDAETGKEITTWKEWEEAGYSSEKTRWGAASGARRQRRCLKKNWTIKPRNEYRSKEGKWLRQRRNQVSA